MLCVSERVVAGTQQVDYEKPYQDDKLRQLQMDVPMKCKKPTIEVFSYVWKIRVTKTTLCRCAIGIPARQIYGADKGKRKKVIEKPAIIQIDDKRT